MMDKEISVRFKISPKARRISVTVKPGGQVVAVRPIWSKQADVFRFLASKEKWIARAIGKMIQKKAIGANSGVNGFKMNKEAARLLVIKKISQINKQYRFKVGQIRIKNQVGRWGSCSARGNLNFNYRIALLPDNLAEYVVVHELCHLKELNHSPAFWRLVALTVPNHRALRRELRNVVFS